VTLPVQIISRIRAVDLDIEAHEGVPGEAEVLDKLGKVQGQPGAEEMQCQLGAEEVQGHPGANEVQGQYGEAKVSARRPPSLPLEVAERENFTVVPVKWGLILVSMEREERDGQIMK